MPLIQAGEITRKRQSYPAPREAWVWAFNRVIEARDSGKLTPPFQAALTRNNRPRPAAPYKRPQPVRSLSDDDPK